MNVGGERGKGTGRTQDVVRKRKRSSPLTMTTASQQQLKPPHSAGGGLTRAHQASTARSGVPGVPLTDVSPESQPACHMTISG